MNLILSTIVVSAVGALNVQLSVDKNTVKSGEVFTYTIKYSNSSTTDAANDVVITDVLPAGIEYVSSNTSSDVEYVDVSGQTVRFVFKSALASGVTGMVKVSAKFSSGTTINNTTVINSATIAAGSGEFASSEEVAVTAVTDPATWNIAKSKLVPLSTDPVPDRDVQYKIDITSNNVIGGQNLKNVVVVDRLPLNAVFVYASDSGVYSEAVDSDTGNTIRQVTWNIGNMSVGSSKSVFVTVRYPSTHFNVGDPITNVVNGTAKMYDDSDAPSRTAQCSHSIMVRNFAVGNITKNGRQADDRYSVGQTADFEIGNIRNLSNVPIDKISIVDNIPSQITLTKVSVGKFSSFAKVKVSYQRNTTPGIWEEWVGGSFDTPNNETLLVSSLPLEMGEYITAVKWDFTHDNGLPIGVANTKNLSVSGIINNVSAGTNIVNTAQLTASLDGESDLVKSASKTIRVLEQMPWLQPTKSVIGDTFYNYDDTVTYNLRVQNHSFATGNYVNPRLIDLLPPEFGDVQYDGVEGVDWIKGSGADITGVTYSISTKVIGGKTYKVLKWDCMGTLEPGEYVDIKFKAQIKALTQTGYLTNDMYISTQNDGITLENVNESVSDVNDMDEDGNTSDRFVKAQAKIFVKFQGRLSADKWIRGELEEDTNHDLIPDVWEKYPNSSKTLPGGIVDYKLVVQNNDSNGPISNIVIIDKLPQIGDTGVIDLSQRNTKWTPYLVNKITGDNGAALPAGVQTYYTTNANPSLEELSDTINKHGQAGDLWSLTPPEDITAVKALKFVFNGVTLNPGESISLQWSMRAPAGAPLNQIAWNSFAYGATFKDSNGIDQPFFDASFLPAEPVKVGHKIELHPVNKYRLGNYVWEDMNMNGIQESGEPGINGILVNLYNGDTGNLIKYTRTGFDQAGEPGYYYFPNLPAGNYKLEFVYPSRYKVTILDAGADDNIDSDIDSSTIADAEDNGPKKSVRTGIITIVDSDVDNVDAGLYRVAALGDKVWNDYDADGSQDAGENGISGITVQLLNEAGDTILDTTATDASGSYSFTDLDPGKYLVRFVNADGKYKFTTVNAGGVSSALNSDAVEAGDSLTGTTAVITLISGENNLNIDAGMYLAQIGDFVWEDMDADGIRDVGENGLDGVVVRLFSADGATPVTDAYGNIVNQVTTSGGGFYKFDNLTAGDYVVEFVKPAAYDSFSDSNIGANDAVDSDADAISGKTALISLSRGGRYTNIDCGLYKLAALGDRVWNDADADGSQDAGENGIPNVNVYLLNAANDAVLSIAITNASGFYSFSNLKPGTYKVKFDRPDEYDRISPANAAGDTIDSDGTYVTDGDSTAVTAAISLASGQVDNTVDLGLYNAGRLGDYVWEDLNANGIQDPGEAGVEGVTVRLKDLSHNTVMSDTTDSNGLYSFTKVTTGNYYIEFELPADFDKITLLNAGGDSSKDNNADAGGKTANITINYGDIDTTIDAGIYKYASIGNLVWDDYNKNGIQDAGEPGISGVTVELYDFSGTLKATEFTDTDGTYSFDNLVPGQYKVKVLKPLDYFVTQKGQGANTESDSDIEADGMTDFIAVVSGQAENSLDAGLYKKASVGDYVWKDVNNNGVQDPTEAGISGVELKLYDALGNELNTVFTDSNGLYTFNNLEPGSYQIKIKAPNGMMETYELDGIHNQILDVVLISGENKVDADFGFNIIPIIVFNNPPITQNYSLETPINTPVSGRVIGEDIDGDTLFYSKSSEPSNGSSAVLRDGTWTYTPDTDFAGTDTFEVIVEDFRGGSAISVITIKINNPAYDLAGTITDVKSGKIIIGAEILFKDIAGNIKYSVVSDNNGRYLIENVKLGGYIMEVSKLGYSGVSTATIIEPEKTNKKLIIRDAQLANIGIDLVANPSTIVGDGIQTSLLTTTVTDQNNIPIAGVAVVFSAGKGSFPNGNTGITDSNGKASVVFKSDKIEGVESILVPIKARVDDEGRMLHAEDQILMTFEPGSIQGIVIENATGMPIQGAKIVVSKDFDGDGTIDFYAEMLTGPDGRYKIAIPKGGVSYDVKITKPFIIGGKTVYYTFNQATNAGEISGSKSEIFDADKTAAGLILYTNTDGTIAQFDNYSNYSISIFQKDLLYDSDGTMKKGSDIIPELDNIDAESGTFVVANLEKNKVYTFATMYEFENGQKIIVGTVDVSIGSDGEFNICSTLIDPYGDITDAVTGELIEGAFVQLHYADTQRNRDAGRGPGSLVELPILDNFPPADNENPQYSDVNGKYAYMVFPNTDYYITAVKDGYEDYTSATISVDMEIVRHDFEMTPKKEQAEEPDGEEPDVVDENQEEPADNENTEPEDDNQPADDESEDEDTAAEDTTDTEDNEDNNQKDDTTATEDDTTDPTIKTEEESNDPSAGNDKEENTEEQVSENDHVLPKTGVLFDIRLLEALLAILVLTAVMLRRRIKKQSR